MSKLMINKDMTISGTSYTLDDLCKKIDNLNTNINNINTKLNRTRTIASLTLASGVTIAANHHAIAIKDPLTGIVGMKCVLYQQDIVQKKSLWII